MKMNEVEDESHLFKCFNRNKNEYTFRSISNNEKIYCRLVAIVDPSLMHCNNLQTSLDDRSSSPNKHMEGKFKQIKDF